MAGGTAHNRSEKDNLRNWQLGFTWSFVDCAEEKMKRGIGRGAVGSVRLAALLALLAARSCLAGVPFTPSNGFQAQPFTGQGGKPSDPPSIVVSALLQQLLAVDDKSYRASFVLVIGLRWMDPEAERKVMQATDRFRNSTEAECVRPCASDFTLSKRKDQGYTTRVSCCDDLWLPTVRMLNMYALPPARQQPYEITVDKDTVRWGVTVAGEIYTPFNVEDFPFDSQALKLQFEYSKQDYIKEFLPGPTTKRSVRKGAGDIVYGWHVDDVVVVADNVTYMALFGENETAGLLAVGASKMDKDSNFTSFDIVIHVHRLHSFYMMALFAPMFLLVILSFATYTMPLDMMAVRISFTVTLFLSLTAMQFRFNDLLPHSSYPTAASKVVLVSYCCVAVCIPVTIAVYYLMLRANNGINDIKDSFLAREGKKVYKQAKIVNATAAVLVFVTVVISMVLIMLGL